MNEFKCPETCKYFNKPLPRNIPTPTCRLLMKYNKENNPITRSIYREILQKRLRCGNIIEE